MTATRSPEPARCQMVQMSAMSRNVMTPGSAMPGSAGRTGCEPVANTSFENGRRLSVRERDGARLRVDGGRAAAVAQRSRRDRATSARA